MSGTKLNILPVPTFRWLGVNGAERDTDGLAAKELAIAAKPGEKRTSLLWIDSEGITDVKITVPEGAAVKLVEVFDVPGQAVSKVTAELGDSAAFELVQLYLGGDTVSEAVIGLNGRRSSFTADIGYMLGGQDKLDLNLIANHTGRKTLSQINAKGVLDGDAVKTFKGTIDFKNGASGAKGSEKEDVLLMSGSAVNKTVPLILCAEDDVEGSHGASIGRIDEREVFYMQTRGIPEEKICELAALGKLRQILSKIGDEDTVIRINKRLGRGEEDE
ncbi:MAG: SufD family Fe-S cluster assembly protein [Ruminococcus sp.]|nr:SufD family Fe-S cluster assembly protein [Ruminococcus sp.]